jgi:hypothetical protein
MKQEAKNLCFFEVFLNFFIDTERMILCQKRIKLAENERKLGLKCYFYVNNC